MYSSPTSSFFNLWKYTSLLFTAILQFSICSPTPFQLGSPHHNVNATERLPALFAMLPSHAVQHQSYLNSCFSSCISKPLNLHYSIKKKKKKSSLFFKYMQKNSTLWISAERVIRLYPSTLLRFLQIKPSIWGECSDEVGWPVLHTSPQTQLCNG